MPIDYNRYPPNWKTEIVPKVLERAGDCCEQCGLANRQTVFAVKFWMREGSRYKYRTIWFSSEGDAYREAQGGEVRKVRIILTIAHLDHDETNLNISLDRLKALCQICHLRYDAKEKYRRVQEKWKTK